MGWKNHRGNRRTTKKLSAEELHEAYYDYLQSHVSTPQMTKIDLWLKNLITYDECFNNHKSINVVLATL